MYYVMMLRSVPRFVSRFVQFPFLSLSLSLSSISIYLSDVDTFLHTRRESPEDVEVLHQHADVVVECVFCYRQINQPPQHQPITHFFNIYLYQNLSLLQYNTLSQTIHVDTLRCVKTLAAALTLMAPLAHRLCFQRGPSGSTSNSNNSLGGGSSSGSLPSSP